MRSINSIAHHATPGVPAAAAIPSPSDDEALPPPLSPRTHIQSDDEDDDEKDDDDYTETEYRISQAQQDQNIEASQGRQRNAPVLSPRKSSNNKKQKPRPGHLVCQRRI